MLLLTYVTVKIERKWFLHIFLKIQNKASTNRIAWDRKIEKRNFLSLDAFVESETVIIEETMAARWWMSVDRRDLWVGWHLNPEKKGAATNCSGRVVTYDLVKSNRSTRPRYSVRLIDLSPPKLEACEQFLPFVLPSKINVFHGLAEIYGPVNAVLLQIYNGRNSLEIRCLDMNGLIVKKQFDSKVSKFGSLAFWILDFFKFRSFKFLRSSLKRCR